MGEGLRLAAQTFTRDVALLSCCAAPEPLRLREWAELLDIKLNKALDQLVSVDLIEAEPATAQFARCLSVQCHLAGPQRPARRRPHR